MRPEELLLISNVRLVDQNEELSKETRKSLLRIGAIWSEIKRREVWKEMGFSSLGEAIEEKAPRGYATVLESIQNYDFFVREKRMRYEEYVGKLDSLGMRKMTYARQLYDAEMQRMQDTEEQRKSYTQEVTLRNKMSTIETKSIREAKTFVLEQKYGTGVHVDRTVVRHYSLSEEEDILWQSAINFIKKRVGTEITDHAALSYALQEYMSAFGTRVIKED